MQFSLKRVLASTHTHSHIYLHYTFTTYMLYTIVSCVYQELNKQIKTHEDICYYLCCIQT